MWAGPAEEKMIEPRGVHNLTDVAETRSTNIEYKQYLAVITDYDFCLSTCTPYKHATCTCIVRVQYM